MHRLLGRRPSPAMLVALTALFITLGGGAYAAVMLPRNSVGTAQLKKGAVTGVKLRNGAVTSVKVKNYSLLAKDFKPGQLPRGPQGPQGNPGPTGPKGATGLTGPGYQFTTGTGSPGPTLNTAGTYFVDAEAIIANNGTAPLTGDCGVQTASVAGATGSQAFTAAFVMQAYATGKVSFAGMAVLPPVEAPASLILGCEDSSGSTVTPTSIHWWVSPVG